MLMYILGAFAAYYATSYFFLKNPNIIQKQKKKQWKSKLINQALNKEFMLHISHRGGSRQKLENTIESFDNGLKEGTNILEMDVCLTKDKQIVVIHDNNLKRMCGINKNVEEYNYNDLPKFQDEIKLDFSVNGRSIVKDSKTPYIPKLEEVFTKYPNVHMNIEIKTPHEEFIQLMNQMIVKYKREDITIWGCKDPNWSKRLKSINPNIKRFFSLGGLGDLYKKYLTGTLPFLSIDEDSLQIPIYNREHYEWKKQESKGFMEHVQHRIYFLMIRLLGSQFLASSLFEHLRKRGILVIFWVMNEVEDFENCCNYEGCVGIMTDEPKLLTKFLQNKNKYSQS